MRSRRLRVALPLLFTVGCFRYAPSTAAQATPGDVVRVRLTEAGSARVAPLIGPQAITVDGRMVSVSDTAYVIAVSSVTRVGDSIIPWAGEPVAVPRDAVAATERRVMDTGRSLAIAGAALAAVALTGRWVRNAGGGSGTDTGGPPSP